MGSTKQLLHVKWPYLLLLPLSILCVLNFSAAQVKIPLKPTGFVYNKALVREDSITIDAFFDPLCPDSKAAWPGLKRLVDQYCPRIFLTLHAMPLPYHKDSFSAARALHITEKYFNSSLTFQVFEALMKNQEKFYEWNSNNLTGETILRKFERITAHAIGKGSLPKVKAGYEDVKTDLATRTAYKYGGSRGAIATPYYFLNGFAVEGGAPIYDYKTWKSIIDRLGKTNTSA